MQLNNRGEMYRIPALLVVLVLTAVTVEAKTKKNADPPPSETPTERPKVPLIHFHPSTPDEDKAAIAEAQTASKAVAEALHVTFTEIQTDHFIIFTDWDPREYTFLKRNVELAYVAVARQFDLLPRENVFIGKLPIYMFAKQDDFKQFAKTFDHFDAPKTVTGYCQAFSDGKSHMAMWKPDLKAAKGNVAEAERQWARTLTHEFSHAFIARYRTNQFIPAWLNEGMAEVVANSQFPENWHFEYAQQMADSPQVDDLFDESKRPGGDMYPVMLSMVQSLIRDNPHRFLKYFNEVKDGVEPEQALKDIYNLNNDSLKSTWRKYIKSQTFYGRI